jgi:hypothetical protein
MGSFFMKRFFIVLILLTFYFCNSINVFATDGTLLTEETFLEELDKAQAAATLFTRPEHHFGNDRSPLSIFTDYLVAPYIVPEGKKIRMTGGLSRATAFYHFLKQYFTDDVIDSIKTGAVEFDWDEDQVYWIYSSGRQYDYRVGEAEYSFPLFSEDKIICHMEIDFDDAGHDSFDYVYEKTDGKWLFTSFDTKIAIFERLYSALKDIDELSGTYSLGEEDTETSGSEKNETEEYTVSSFWIGGNMLLIISVLLTLSYTVRQSKRKKPSQFLTVFIVTILLINMTGLTACHNKTEDQAATEEPESRTYCPETTGEKPESTDAIKPTDDQATSEWQYIQNEYGLEITGYLGDSTSIIVPDVIDGIKVIRLNNNVFEKHPAAGSVISVAVSGDVYLQKGCLSGLTGLKELSMPHCQSIEAIGANSTECERLTKELTRIVITVDTVVPDNCFKDMSALKEIVFANGLDKIGAGSFSGCVALKDFSPFSSAIDISEKAFYGCSGLESISVSEKAQHIGRSAFYGCSSVTKIEYNALNCVVDPVPEIQAERGPICTGMKNITEIVIGKNVAELPPYLFYGLQGETIKVTLPDGIKKLGKGLFLEGRFSSNIVIPDSVEEIDDLCFAGCDKIDSVIMSKNIKRIGDYAFASCMGLSEIDLPEGLEIIGDSAFRSCCSLTNLTIPSTVSALGARAFMNCDRIKSINIKGQPKAIPAECFLGCADLNNVHLEATTVGDRAFYLCTGLEQVMISDDATMGEEVFGFCFKLYPDQTFNIPGVH